ncbi:hypothetical protein BGW36DRAFT_428389 [Talaromyces proteolyticus]|uniref:Uncharacterized protein n=1 Tax=Talaromyces proteolyticus TaxID=1131652 RepID=A0AAD4KN00_9EURO|nr:uncharacterized protein BGW36DRAFT_428389 [Talaromyces proteolyticus]KAH8696373.1 hypothetical protein BGW36DRAFT_428389 [Talaromyces proteolyticus]
MEGPIQAALSATQSTVSSTAPAPPERQRRGELVKMFSEPEKLLRKPVSKRSLEAGTQPEPVQTREPQLPPPLPEITMDEGGDNIILNSEASFRELQPEQPSETGFLTLLNQFTNTPRTGDNLVPIGPPRSSPQRSLIQSKPEPPMESEIDSNSSLSSLSDADDEADDPMDVTFVPRARTKTPPKHFSKWRASN